MIYIENITKVRKQDRSYHIEFNDGRIIRLRIKRSILPLMFLIKYGESSNQDFKNERYEYVCNVLRDKTEEDIFKNDYKDKNKPYSDLIVEEGYTFISREIREGRVYYQLDKEDHKLLLEERMQVSYETREDIKEKIYQSQSGLCNICYKEIKREEGVVDYIIPLLRGGYEGEDNIQIICKGCYNHKREKCKECIERCNKESCPIYKEKEITNIMTMPKMAMKKDK